MIEAASTAIHFKIHLYFEVDGCGGNGVQLSAVLDDIIRLCFQIVTNTVAYSFFVLLAEARFSTIFELV